MARGDRKLTNFNDVANDVVTDKETKSNNNIDEKKESINPSLVEQGENGVSLIDQLINETPIKKSTALENKTGVYLDDQVFSILMKLAGKGGRGAKSKIVNDSLRATFREKGLLK